MSEIIDSAPGITKIMVKNYIDTEKLIIKRKNIRAEVWRLTPELMDKIGYDKTDRPSETSYLLKVVSLEDFKTRKIKDRGLIFRASTLNALFHGLREMECLEYIKQQKEDK